MGAQGVWIMSPAEPTSSQVNLHVRTFCMKIQTREYAVLTQHLMKSNGSMKVQSEVRMHISSQIVQDGDKVIGISIQVRT